MPRRFDQLPKFSVVVWVRKTDAHDAIRDELLEVAKNDSYESTEYQGMVDFHWGFDRVSEAKALVNSLSEFAKKPEVVVLRMISGDDSIPSETLKDEAMCGIERGGCKARAGRGRFPDSTRTRGGRLHMAENPSPGGPCSACR